jgi:predicted dehydrogenase
VRTVRFGIIGAGLMGREFASAAARWIHLLDMDIRPQVVAVADPDPRARQWFAERVVGPGNDYADHRELLARDDIEAVYCAVPHDLHESVYLDVLGAGKHMMGEKPFGIDAPANARIAAAVAACPELVVRCSSEFPYFPGPLRVVDAVRSGRLGTVFEVRAAFCHSSDLDPAKPINWKRMVERNGEYGVMGDLGLHVLHLPLRLGWVPTKVFALLSNIVRERPDGKGGLVACNTWDNAILTCTCSDGVSMVLETKRIAPGEMDTWSIEILGDRGGVRWSSKSPKALWTLDYTPGGPQSWAVTDLGYDSVYATLTGSIFEFGFTDAILQMWAAYCDELAHGADMRGSLGCATVAETVLHHGVLGAALESGRTGQAVTPVRIGAGQTKGTDGR